MQALFKIVPLLALVASVAQAQTAAPNYQGQWTGMATAATGAQVRVLLTIKGQGGVLRMTPSANYVTIDQCHDRDLPLSVESQTASELNISIKGDTVLKGCLTETATLKAIDANTLQGTLKDGRTMQLVRK